MTRAGLGHNGIHKGHLALKAHLHSTGDFADSTLASTQEVPASRPARDPSFQPQSGHLTRGTEQPRIPPAGSSAQETPE